MIRTFIALDLPNPMREAIAQDLAVLRSTAPRVKWVTPYNLHLTLKFLGDIKENDLNELFETLEEDISPLPTRLAAIGGIGAFPHWRSPRIVWAGCREGGETLTELQKAVEESCASLGYDRERKAFSPHLTLGRVKLPADAYGLKEAAITMQDSDYGYLDIDEVIVYMSELRRSGPVYSPMKRIRLLGRD